jgi:flagellar biosynthesis protein FlhA
MSAAVTPSPVRALRRSDLIAAAAVVGIVAMLIIPLPPFALDVLIIINLTLSLTVLLTAMNVRQPLEFGAFPSLLLLATLFRLALNVSAARLILLDAHAGSVINAFGQVVVGGNTVVGVVVFLILIVIQWVVITNGSGRVSEVAARFTLDAMPGKQMSIDADLNAGLITADEARVRRRAVERESDFYGAMDGASKFVKGDAVAALVIIAVNIIGGLAIGITQFGYDPATAISTYTVLTVGEGLVAQIGSILVSTAMGILVTRGSSDEGLGSDLGTQLLARPRLLMVSGVILLLLGIVPGFPTLVFLVSGGLVIGAGWFLSRPRPAAEVIEPATVTPAVAAGEAPYEALRVEAIELEVGYGLFGLVDAAGTGGLVERIALIRRQIAQELGLVVPTIRIHDDLGLPAEAYVIRLRGAEIARGTIQPQRLLCMDPAGGELAVDGSPTIEPVFGLPAAWISPADREQAEALGYTVVDGASALATHLAETIRRYAHEILGRQETRALLDALKQDQPAVVEEIVPGLLTLGDVHKVLQALLRERIPIRDLRSILEALADSSRHIKEPLLLAEAARHALARAISQRFRGADGAVHAIALAPGLDTRLGEAVILQPGHVGLDLPGEEARRVVASIEEHLRALVEAGHEPVLLCTTRIRLALRNLAERQLPQLAVLSYEEILPSIPVQVHAQVEA